MFPRTVKLEIPGLESAVRDSAYRGGAADGGAVGFVAGLLLAFALVLVFRRKLP